MLKAEELKAQLEIIDAALRDDGFPVFVEHIFSQSIDVLKDGIFVGGDFVIDISTWLGMNKKTLRVSAKDHFKSMSFYAHIMWKIFRLYRTKKNREINYFSYKENMAAYHLAKIKTAIACNPYFTDIIDLNAQAKSLLCYSWDGKKKVSASPRGLIGFKRGIHCNDVYVDDPFQDPDNKMVPTKIMLINRVMKTQILDMFQDECHIAGTAQTNHDFFFDDEFVSRFSRRILPAVVDEKNRVALWKEWMTFDELMAKKRERGEKVFNQEYLCSPVYAENSFVDSKDRLYSVVNANLKNYTISDWEKEIERRIEHDELIDTDKVGGWDLGKKGHPAHFTIFEKVGKKRIQRHEKWFDRQDYTAQLEYIQGYIEAMGIYRVFYDATRGELDMLEEKGELGGEFQGVHFTFKGKHKMAGAFDRAITNKEVELLNNPRMLNQILVVSNDLQAPETPEGHGDSFWSIGMTFMDQEDEGTDINFI